MVCVDPQRVFNQTEPNVSTTSYWRQIFAEGLAPIQAHYFSRIIRTAISSVRHCVLMLIFIVVHEYLCLTRGDVFIQAGVCVSKHQTQTGTTFPTSKESRVARDPTTLTTMMPALGRLGPCNLNRRSLNYYSSTSKRTMA